MTFQFSLQKVMELREREKKEGQTIYSKAVDDFENTATVLYQLLKSKESLEDAARNQIEKGIKIRDIQVQESQFLRLQDQINKQQIRTQMARKNMQRKQEELMERTIEFKKYQKMKDLKEQAYKENQAYLETNMMDEMSVLMYSKR
ncbi:flagellar export protein FliJ [Alkalihalobacillus trypoxylicola]|uniref:Flagellar FliJ protein n=1 Tax=Alkalihalobacillus trypoxylicola TaxID=519424 RepID=A0A161PL43_9BACI|nr:flagellar export protein FliJ [Alkalihalobacillus trypoxylicola]KYG35056.1 flagellar export protein FliJ [Alkalihalobacillus trypoxylicola]GAF63712.1 flagellar protein FliJ [Bacillus sp. TS-2]